MDQAAQYIVPAIALVTAVILLVAGGRLLKSAIGLSGGLIGVGAGLMIAPSVLPSVSPLIIALICGAIVAIVAVYIAKFAILITLGISCAIVVPVLTWHLAGLGDGTKVVSDVVEAATAAEPESSQSHSTRMLASTQDAITATISMFAEDASNVIRSGYRRANAAWDEIPTGPRLMLVGGAIAGLLAGLLIATFIPMLASSIVTAVAGSILLVESIRNFVALIWSQQTMVNITPTVFVVTTVGIALAGLGLQLTMFRKTAPKKVAKD